MHFHISAASYFLYRLRKTHLARAIIVYTEAPCSSRYDFFPTQVAGHAAERYLLLSHLFMGGTNTFTR